jgi:nucleolar protein 56
MGERYIFTNVVGSFVFDESFNIIDKGEEDEIKKKYKELKRPDEAETKKILSSLKGMVKKLYEPDMEITKQKIKESVTRDILIIKIINAVESTQKAISILAKSLRDWYELHNPEFSKSIESHEKFIELILKKSRRELLNEIGLSEKDSMGAELSKDDLEPVLELARETKSLFGLKIRHEKYLEKIMEGLCPNITAVAGSLIGAKLIAHAGSLFSLVKMPASTIQLLGAERALFRHIRTGSRCPKYGLIFNHHIVSQATNKGKAARILADKISIASRVDYFEGEFIGNKLRWELENCVK